MESAVSIADAKVLVTGASGFIGAHLCRRLIAGGAEVYGLSRNQRAADDDPIRWRQADVSDSKAVRALVGELRPDLVFHLASHVMGSPALEHVLPTFRANLKSTVNLLTAVAETGCRRIVLTGSLAEPELEAGEKFPSAPYAAAKWASSGYARMFHALYGVPAVLARVFMVYGPDQKDISKLVPYLTLALLRGETPTVTSGARLIDWIYVHDVVEGMVALATTPGLEGSTLELGSGTLVSIRDIVDALERIIGVEGATKFGALPDRPLEPTRLARVAETTQRIDWAPQVSLEDGLRKTVEWYRGKLSAYSA